MVHPPPNHATHLLHAVHLTICSHDCRRSSTTVLHAASLLLVHSTLLKRMMMLVTLTSSGIAMTTMRMMRKMTTLSGHRVTRVLHDVTLPVLAGVAASAPGMVVMTAATTASRCWLMRSARTTGAWRRLRALAQRAGCHGMRRRALRAAVRCCRSWAMTMKAVGGWAAALMAACSGAAQPARQALTWRSRRSSCSVTSAPIRCVRWQEAQHEM